MKSSRPKLRVGMEFFENLIKMVGWNKGIPGGYFYEKE